MDDIPQLQEQWERDWRKPADDLHRFSEFSKGTLPKGLAPRVSQLDSSVLDNEVEDLITGDLLQALSSGLLSEERIDAWKPEILAAVRTAIWAVTVGRKGCTYGSDLQNFHFTPQSFTFAKKVIHFSLSVGLPWLCARLEREMSRRKWWAPLNDTDNDNAEDDDEANGINEDDTDSEVDSDNEKDEKDDGSKIKSTKNEIKTQSKQSILNTDYLKYFLWRSFHSAETIVRTASIANFLVFLFQEKYPTLVSRILRLEPVPTNPNIRRSLLYDQMNRQLFWEGFSEVALLTLPLLRSRAVRRFTARVARKVRGLPVLKLIGAIGDAGSSDPGAGIVSCAICGASPIQTPYHPDCCKHLFCYQCLYAAKNADDDYCCPVCTLPVNKIVRYSVESSEN